MRDPNRCTFSTTAASQQVQIFIARSFAPYTREHTYMHRLHRGNMTQQIESSFCFYSVYSELVLVSSPFIWTAPCGSTATFKDYVSFSVWSPQKSKDSDEVSSRELPEIFFLSTCDGQLWWLKPTAIFAAHLQLFQHPVSSNCIWK